MEAVNTALRTDIRDLADTVLAWRLTGGLPDADTAAQAVEQLKAHGLVLEEELRTARSSLAPRSPLWSRTGATLSEAGGRLRAPLSARSVGGIVVRAQNLARLVHALLNALDQVPPAPSPVPHTTVRRPDHGPQEAARP
ncbi:DUF6415 family natural product biosynthesis protein [Streptomyces kanasensis]|uniref:DUF6415 family natural product biosynthesis protein n=1 Tax=Streptomyces kanasensis TaxID=936756 RepID=UPI0036FB54E7